VIFHAVPIEQNSLISSMSAINLHEVFHPGPTGPAIAIAYPYTLLVAEHMPYLGRPVITVEQQGHSTFARGLEPYLVTYIHIYLSCGSLTSVSITFVNSGQSEGRHTLTA